MNRILLIISFAVFYASAHGQELAITFDDAPTFNGPIFNGSERTDKILAQLKLHGIEQVSFFVVTGNIDAQGKERLQRYANAGHLLANHTHSHQWIHTIGVNKYCKDIQRADSILRPMRGFVPWFRYPFLDEGRSKPVRDSIRTAIKDLDLMNGYVTIDNYDWYLNSLLKDAVDKKNKINYDELRKVYIEHIWTSLQFYDEVAKQHIGRSPKHVLLLHENDLSALFLGDLISFLKNQGWKIISPRIAYEDAIAIEIPDVLFNGQGRVAAIARSKNVAAKDLVQTSEDEAYLDKLVKDRKIFK